MGTASHSLCATRQAYDGTYTGTVTEIAPRSVDGPDPEMANIGRTRKVAQQLGEGDFIGGAKTLIGVDEQPQQDPLPTHQAMLVITADRAVLTLDDKVVSDSGWSIEEPVGVTGGVSRLMSSGYTVGATIHDTTDDSHARTVYVDLDLPHGTYQQYSQCGGTLTRQ